MKRFNHKNELTKNSSSVALRERFTNILVRLRIFREHETINDKNEEYINLLKEAKEILADHPEWNDIASTWLLPPM